ncbi:hypothetical protein P3X46_017821 [Hevea brasiliensis]|uniref:Uncharacterized protein n=1 Tax=Hevea brasiliensis TaxID=3981 RepID=A0ABQ9LSL8_HEVBR|nr:uncharacterized protein LOC110649573 [Hevea brasiliensis]KAJ9169658.1 hypothetical protein P3X46_017821 [Hevea brasiliensis]
MGCFLACFGSSKDRKRRKQRHKVQPREQRNAGYNPVQSAVSLVHSNPEKPTNPVSEIRDNPEKQLTLGARKKVTFDSSVTTYEHVSVEESIEFSAENEDGSKREEEEENFAKSSQSQSYSEDGSITSSSGSYPSNHRYLNCRDSDDELDYGESEIEDDDEEDEDDGVLDYNDIYEDDGILESRSKVSLPKGTPPPFTEEIESPAVVSGLPERELKPNPNVRDRSAYVHSVLNPVENLTQWKAVKAKGTPPLKQQKENFTLGQEPRISFSSEPSFRELQFCFNMKSDQSKKSNQEIAVDASLSNWLGSSENTTINKPSTIDLGTITPEKSMSLGSNSPRSFEDRPILGALTVEELKQISLSSSPRRSPSHSPDEMAIIGTVGTYWNHSGSGNDSGSVSSFKGIPNTTSKYREDKRVNWHSTPFETRLERALNGGAAAEAYHTHTFNVH